MKERTRGEWDIIFTNSPTNESTGKILKADVHRARQTDPVKRLLQSKRTILVNNATRVHVPSSASRCCN